MEYYDENGIERKNYESGIDFMEKSFFPNMSFLRRLKRVENLSQDEVLLKEAKIMSLYEDKYLFGVLSYFNLICNDASCKNPLACKGWNHWSLQKGNHNYFFLKSIMDSLMKYVPYNKRNRQGKCLEYSNNKRLGIFESSPLFPIIFEELSKLGYFNEPKESSLYRNACAAMLSYQKGKHNGDIF
jgi:hypothetical protein